MLTVTAAQRCDSFAVCFHWLFLFLFFLTDINRKKLFVKSVVCVTTEDYITVIQNNLKCYMALR